jgi:O-antigen/teichoic acid export membrane protein
MLKKLSNYGGEASVAFLRLCSIAVGPIAALAIATRMTPVEQGYYYSFVSILGARVAFDAGVAQVIINTAGQEGRSLSVSRSGGISGPQAAIAAMRDVFRFALWWYAGAAAAMMLFVGVGGYVFFAGAPTQGVNWQAPWILFVVMGSIDFSLLGFWTILEGLNKIVYVYVFKSIKTASSVLALAVIVFSGGGLWSVVGYMAAAIALNVTLILFWRPVFVFLSKKAGGVLSWRKSIWPFQWRMAVSWASGYLGQPLFVPILFRLESAVAAGKVGMTLAVLNVASGLAQSVIDAKIPYFCGLIAEGRRRELETQFVRRGAFSILLYGAIVVCGVIAILILDAIGIRFSARIVGWTVFALFATAIAVNQIVNIEANYMRCHRSEPMMWPSVIGGILTMAMTVFMAGRFGSAGVAAGYVGMTVFFGLMVATAVLIRFRRKQAAASAGN